MSDALPKKEDLRVRRTKKLLSDALFELVKKNAFEKITVCDICDAAMVHRATFYSHFSDKYELLNYSMNEHLPLSHIEESLSDEELNDAYFSAMIEKTIKSVCDDKQIYASILKKNKEYSIVDRTQEFLEISFSKRIKEKLPEGILPVKPEILASFYVGACMNVMIKWITGDIQMTEDELIKSLRTLLSFSPEYIK